MNNNCKSLVIDEIHIKRCSVETENKDKEFCPLHDFKKYMDKDAECAICYESIDASIEVFLKCGHIYHRNCLHRSKLNHCPYCKTNLQEDELKYFTCDSDFISDGMQQHLRELIKENESAQKLMLFLHNIQKMTICLNYIVIGFVLYKRYKSN